MGQIGEILGFGFQARIEFRTVVELMDGVDPTVRRPSLKERLGLKGLACCGGATWPTTMDDGDGDEAPQNNEEAVAQDPIENGQIPPPCTSSGMNLAAALAAERQLRAALDNRASFSSPSPVTVPGTPSRMSLMRLLEETDGYDGAMMRKEVEDGGGGGGGCDSVCCVCMARKRGAAFIPCGHTFCRVCSRELWLNRGSCPLCNRSIFEILDIF